MRDEDALLSAIDANPAEDTPRLGSAVFGQRAEKSALAGRALAGD